MKISERIKKLEREVAELRSALTTAIQLQDPNKQLCAGRLTIVNAAGVPVLQVGTDEGGGGVLMVADNVGHTIAAIQPSPGGGVLSAYSSASGLPRAIVFAEGDAGHVLLLAGSGSETRLTAGQSVAYDPDGVSRHIQGG